MKVNSESIYGTRPWKIFGEGPAQEAATKINAQGFNECKGKPFTHEDIRFAPFIITPGCLIAKSMIGINYIS